ncbi:MAG: helix-turn-helix transcriptional regulator [Pseudomonadota bacterium]
MGEEYNDGNALDIEPAAERSAFAGFAGFTGQAGNAGHAGHPVTRNLVLRDLKQIRLNRGESQAMFWARFGVTQSSGSRFETGLGVPPAVAILIKLYISGRLSDGDLVV